MFLAKTVGKICVVKDDARHEFLKANNFTNVDAVETDGICAANLASGLDELWLGSNTSFEKIVSDALSG